MKKFKLLIGVLVLLLSGCFMISEPSESAELQFQTELMHARTLIREANVGVKTDLFRQVFGGAFERMAGNSQGSGVIFFEDETHYYALTNFHVIDPKDFARASYQVTPSYHPDRPIEASLVAFDASKDLAVLKFPKNDLNLHVINIDARLNQPFVAREFLLAVGNPSAVNSIVTYGEYLNHVDIRDVDFKVILHSALIFPGNSGGALTDLQGNLVGINTWRSQQGDERNLAVPLEEIHAFLNEIQLRTGE